MSSKTLLTPTRRPLALLAVLLLLCGLAFPGTARAQDGPGAFVGTCIPGLELPAELAELDLAGLQAALQALVAQNAEATVALTQQGDPSGIVRADLLLADEAVLVALLEGQAVNATYEFPEGEPVIVAIEASTAEDCTDTLCVSGIELPAALADLDVEGLRAALEGLIAGDADATVPVTVMGTGEPFRVRADLLIGLSDPLLEAVLTGEPVSVSVTGDDAIISIALPGPECEEGGGPQEPEPKPGTIPDNQQGGGKDTTHDGQQGGGDKTPDNQQTDDKDTGAGDDQQAVDKDTGAGDDGQVPDNQQEGEDKDTDTGAGDDQQEDTKDDGTGAGDDVQDDVQDDPQVEVPEELPKTGAGGLAAGGSVPAGNVTAGLTLLAGAGYAVLRRR